MPAVEVDHTHGTPRRGVTAPSQLPVGSESVPSIPGNPAVFPEGKSHGYIMCLIDSIYMCLYLHIPIFTMLTAKGPTSEKGLKGKG